MIEKPGSRLLEVDGDEGLASSRRRLPDFKDLPDFKEPEEDDGVEDEDGCAELHEEAEEMVD